MGRHLHALRRPEALSCKVWVSPRVTPPIPSCSLPSLWIFLLCRGFRWAPRYRSTSYLGGSGCELKWVGTRQIACGLLWRLNLVCFFLQKFYLCFNLTLNTAGKNQCVTLPVTDWCPTEQFATSRSVRVRQAPAFKSANSRKGTFFY